MAERRLKSLLSSSFDDIKNLSGSALRTAYKSAAASIRGRRRAFEKAGKLSALPERYREGVPSVSSFDSMFNQNDPKRTEKIEKAMREALGENLGYIRGEVSTLSGYERVIDARAKAVGAKLGIDFKSNADFNRFGEFMGEMQTRLKSMWKPASDFVVDLYKQAQRLNLNPMQLMKNYEYWRDHLEDLENLDPIEGRNRELRPSDYIKKAKLEKISDYYKMESSHDVISSAARKPSRGRKKRR